MSLKGEPRNKLTQEDVDLIRWKLKKGVWQKHLAEEYGVDVSTIKKIQTRHTWKVTIK